MLGESLLNMIFYFQYIRYLWENKIRFYYIRNLRGRGGVSHPKGYIKLIKIISFNQRAFKRILLDFLVFIVMEGEDGS